jgi:hypothetical protein
MHRLERASARIPLLLAFLAGSALLPVAASAEPAHAPVHVKTLAQSLTGAAKDAFTSAQMLLNNGDAAGALTKYTLAYDLSKDPRVLFDMALCERNLHRYAHMQTLLVQYKREAADTISAEDRSDTDNAIAAIKKLVGSVRLAVNEQGATVTVDDQQVGFTPLADSIVLDLGKHALSVSKTGFNRVTQTVPIVGGDDIPLSVTLVPEKHVGQLVIASDDGATVAIDGQVVGKGRFEGELAPGAHQVSVTETGKRPYGAEIDLRDGETRTVDVSLESEKHGAPIWPWVVGGVVVAAGAAIGGYFLFRPGETTTAVPVYNPNATFQLSSWKH